MGPYYLSIWLAVHQSVEILRSPLLTQDFIDALVAFDVQVRLLIFSKFKKSNWSSFDSKVVQTTWLFLLRSCYYYAQISKPFFIFLAQTKSRRISKPNSTYKRQCRTQLQHVTLFKKHKCICIKISWVCITNKSSNIRLLLSQRWTIFKQEQWRKSYNLSTTPTFYPSYLCLFSHFHSKLSPSQPTPYLNR